ncbi:MAG TPA: hypothetical protein VMV34_02485 [Terriglobia bacterium]|nr:hypothetical protein [Terriglobia bacterium]
MKAEFPREMAQGGAKVEAKAAFEKNKDDRERAEGMRDRLELTGVDQPEGRPEK